MDDLQRYKKKKILKGTSERGVYKQIIVSKHNICVCVMQFLFNN